MSETRPSDQDVLERCADYLDRLSLTSEQKENLLTRLRRKGETQNSLHDAAAMMASLHRLLAGRATEEEADQAVRAGARGERRTRDRSGAGDPPDPAYVSIFRRIRQRYREASGRNPAASVPDARHSLSAALRRGAHRRAALATQPPLHRASMAPSSGDDDGRSGRIGGRIGHTPTAPEPPLRWHRVAVWRRLILLALILAQTYVATNAMVRILPYHGGQFLEIPILVLFAVLFGWISAGFWTALAGFVLLLRGRDRYAVTQAVKYSDMVVGNVIPPGARTAIIMPICNENVARVFAGLRATYESLEQTGELDRFDFFILSDSYEPDIRVAENEAWADLCHALDGFGRIFYRWRQHRIKRKSGNVADFCRRWGKDYRYMIVLDADSVMTGECLTALVRLAEAHPNAGIIQTAPRAAGRETFYARMQQFATCVYGPLFTAGLHFWQLGESHYWGHNAIIRVAPFMRHCALARLPGRGALAGEILSHDFVEAALMRRAGWAVWIAYDLPGSYEEMPPNLIDELSRDRRWCQGNLMNFRLFLMKGLHPAHRAVFVTGAMAYLSAPLWFAFLLLSTALLALHTLAEPQYFVAPYQLFPIWPEWHEEWAVSLFGATAVCLFLPKILSVLLLMRRNARPFGGGVRLVLSMAGELVMSALLAPIRMLFHTQFVLAALFGVTVGWRSPPREDAQTPWSEALRRHGWHTLLGVVWTGFVAWLNPSFLWWLLPVVGALLFSIPISVYSSRVTLGRSARKRGFFLIPEETEMPPVVAATAYYNKIAPSFSGVQKAVIDPFVNALTCATHTVRRKISTAMQAQREELFQTALTQGVDTLSDQQRNRLISDPALLSRLHYAVWSSAAGISADDIATD